MLYEKVQKAMNDVKVSQRLDAAAVLFRTLFRSCVAEPKFGGKYGFGLSAADVADDLRIECAHGQIRLVYDQVFRDGFLRGRFTFFLVKKNVLDELEAVEIHAFLFNDEQLATQGVGGTFVWTCHGAQLGDATTHDMMAALLMGVVNSIPVLPS